MDGSLHFITGWGDSYFQLLADGATEPVDFFDRQHQPSAMENCQLGNHQRKYILYLSIDGKPIMKTRKTDAGEYYIKYENYTDGLGSEVTGNETIVLKDYLPVGSSWTDTYIETVTETGFPPEDSNVEIVSSIIARDATLTVPGGSFTNVIVVKRVKTTTAADLSVATSTMTYYFAKDHGPIQIKTEDELGNVTLEKLSAHILY
jgi:hypothetical protein